MSLNKRLIAAGPAPRCGVTGFNSTIETGSMAKNTSGSTISGMAYGESSGTGYMAIANDTMYIYNADGSSLGSKSITTGHANVACIYHDNKFWANCNGWRSYTIASSPSETIVGAKAAMINWLCDDPNDSNRYFCGYRSDSNVYTISKSNFLDDTPTLLFSNKIGYSSYGDGVGSVTSDGDYIWVMAYNPSGNTTTIRQYDPATWDVYADSDYTTTAISGSNYIGNMVYNRSNNRMWHVRAYSNGANKYVPIVGPTCSTPSTYTVDFLVVAGAGGGAGVGGAGGAGGLRTSYGSNSGGGASAESSTTITIGSVYAIIIGAGGSASAGGSPNYDGVSGGSGNDSVFSQIRSIGGGGGGSSNTNGKNGGSGGGARFATAGSGTTNQGYAGGNAAGAGLTNTIGGGGGGASQVGNSTGNNGGNGLAVSITGSSVTYAGGGGGGGNTGGSTPYDIGLAGTGGGGDGGGNNGTANTGSGGGGGTWTNNANYNTQKGGDGGSGVVVIRVATSNYSGTTTGSPTITTSGSDTIIKFTGSGTYTA